jgi:peptide/nickel transport system permease protein
VLGIIAERLPATLKLETLSVILVYACAIPTGIYAAVRRNRPDERALTVALFLLYSLPTFWTGLLMLVFFCGDRFLNIFPVAGLAPDSYLTWGVSYWRILAETARHYVLPVVCLSYAGLAGLSRYARVGILEIARQDYIRTARAKGLPERTVILKHVFRNGLLPLVTLFAGLLPGLIGGSIIVEYIFSIHGVGSLSIMALTSRDYTLMMALFTIGALLTLLGIMISDLLYAVVDPRITYE